jgi:hypothetical protein
VKKTIIALILLVANALPVATFGVFLYGAIAPEVYEQHVSEIEPDTVTPPSKRSTIVQAVRHADPEVSLTGALVAVVVIFLVTVLVLWLLSKIGGPLTADVKASVNKFGGRITVAAAAIVGAFLAIAITGVAALYILIH